jgi:hypothetical protein
MESPEESKQPIMQAAFMECPITDIVEMIGYCAETAINSWNETGDEVEQSGILKDWCITACTLVAANLPKQEDRL